MSTQTQLSETVDSRYLRFSPRAHAYLITVVPAAAIIGVIVLAATGHPPTWLDLCAFLVLYALSITGMTVGFHRYFTHLTFSTKPWLRDTLLILGSMAGQGPVVYWVALHRRHHQRSDQTGDPHSPYIKRERALHGWERFLHSHFGWAFDHDVPSTLHYAPDWLREPRIMRLSQGYYLWMSLGIVVPSAVCGLLAGSWWAALSGALWAGPIRIYAGENAIWTITSLTHLFGRQDYQSSDQSRNLGWLSLLTFGESWHNNHHAFPWSARFGLEWWQVDIGAMVIRTFGRLGWAWDIKHPTLEQRSKRRIDNENHSHTLPVKQL
jgi:stearoyl-CoA desaturase (delta-9 desaturase)